MSFKKWEVFRANLDPVIGSEQGKSRPVLIISENFINELINTVNILPITSKKKGRQIYPNEVLLDSKTVGLENESIILSHQIRTLDKKGLSVKYGTVFDYKKQIEILDSVSFQLGIV